MNATLRSTLVKALGGKASGKYVKAPGPLHSKNDDFLVVWLDPAAPDGFRVHSHSGDDWKICRDYVKERLGDRALQIAREPREPRKPEKTPPPPVLWPALWRRAVDAKGTLAEKYLWSRELELPDVAAGEAIRFDQRCQFGAGAAAERHPALVCLIRNIVTNEPQGIQRTALTPDGAAIKRNGKTLRMSLGAMKGGAIKIDPDEHVEQGLCIGEGLETCLAGRKGGLAPIWAALSAGGIAAFPVLPGIDGLTILCENDETNVRAVEECGARWTEAGRDALVVFPLVGSDWNDMRGRTAQ